MSIPTSLIVVVLVLAWLVVLVPMVARRREAVPEAEMAGGTFRVLQRSTEMPRRRPTFRRRPDREDGDGAESPADEHLSDDSELDEELLDEEYDDTDDDGDEYDSDEYGYDGYDDFDDEHSDEPAAAAPMTASAGRSTGSHPYRPSAEPASAGSHPYRPEVRREPEPASSKPERGRYQQDSVSDLDEPHPVNVAAAPAQHADDMHLRPIPRRAGRGGYDPDAAEAARQFKYSRRRRVAVVLLLATLLFSAAAVVVNPVLWAGTAVFGLLLIGYLAYLRRQVQIEANIRERRLARLRRARQIRPEYDTDRFEPVTGSSFGRGMVPASQVPASQVPATGYRRGREIVDLDDDDPAFEDLEYYQPLTYRRASGQ